MKLERTLVILKPDAVQRGLMGAIIGRIERRGLRVAALKMMAVSPALAERHYGEHQGKPFYAPLLGFITSGPSVAMVIEGPQAIAVVRAMLGKTDARQAAPGTIRGDYSLSNRLNLVHGSDSAESAQREIALFFDDADILEYNRDMEAWIDPDTAW